MGEIAVDPMSGAFVMQTPAGSRRVTLVCTKDGELMVGEVARDIIDLETTKISVVTSDETLEKLDTLSNDLAKFRRKRIREQNSE